MGSGDAMRHPGLTGRAADVALLMAQGRSNAGIAQRPDISESTARHVQSVLHALRGHGRAAVPAILLGQAPRR